MTFSVKLNILEVVPFNQRFDNSGLEREHILMTVECLPISVGIIGNGFVGGSLTTVLSERGINVFTYDKAGKQAKGGLHPKLVKGKLIPTESVKEFVLCCKARAEFNNVYFVCVPTPMYEDGSADLSIVEGVLREMSEIPGEKYVVVKSTVPPGSVDKWNKEFSPGGMYVGFIPEFLTEANALNDMRNQKYIIIGTEDDVLFKNVSKVFERAFEGTDCKVTRTSSTNAEMTKYVINCFLATKVAFANEMEQICSALKASGLPASYTRVSELVRLDPRVGQSHWSVPGPVATHDGRKVRGFGGHCVVDGTRVLTTYGYVNVKDVNPGMVISSTDHNHSFNDTKTVTEKHSRLYDGDVYQFTVIDDVKQYNVTCTPEHLLPVTRNFEKLLVKAEDVLETDKLVIASSYGIKSRSIFSITKEHYSGIVHNIELQTNSNNNEDDLFWICDGIVVHNCFPKDINALITTSKQIGVDPKIIQAAWDKNLELRPSKDRDWEHMQGRAVSKKSEVELSPPVIKRVSKKNS